jgi:hypothetical protein
VTVTAETPRLQVGTSNVSLLVNAAQIRDLPFSAKDFQQLTFLAPGMGGKRGNNASLNFCRT